MGDTDTHQGGDGPMRGQPSKGRHLDSITFGSRTTGEAAMARSQRIKRLRLALPIVALVLATVFLFSSKSNKVDDAFLKDFEDMSAAAEELKMASPKFSGVDENGRPFEITAATATQVGTSRDFLKLDHPRAVQGKGDDVTTVTADKGLYKSEANVLELEDNVTLSHNLAGDTFVLRAPAATVSIKDEVVTSNTGIDGQSTDGSKLKADTMTAYKAEGRVVFKGNVSMRIYPKSINNGTEAAILTEADIPEHNSEEENLHGEETNKQ